MKYLFILAVGIIIGAAFNYKKWSYKEWYKRCEINAKHPDWTPKCNRDFMKEDPDWFVKNGYKEALEDRGDITISESPVIKESNCEPAMPKRPAKKEVDPEHMTIEDVCKIGGEYDQKAWYNLPHSANFVSGDDVISIFGSTIEDGWESFRGTLTIILNNEVLYNEESSCVDSYRIKVFNNGKFDKESEAFDYLINLFQGREFKQEELAINSKELKYSPTRR